MVTVRDLKVKLGLDSGEFIKGMRDAEGKTRKFKDSLRTAAKHLVNLEVTINASKIDKTKLPSSIKVAANKTTLLDSIDKIVKVANRKAKRALGLTIDTNVLKESIEKWVSKLHGGTRIIPKLPLKADKGVLKNSVVDAIADMKSHGHALFRQKANMLPLQVDVRNASGKKAGIMPGVNNADVIDKLDQILNSIGTGTKTLKEHVDDAGKSGGMDMMGGMGAPF